MRSCSWGDGQRDETGIGRPSLPENEFGVDPDDKPPEVFWLEAGLVELTILGGYLLFGQLIVSVR